MVERKSSAVVSVFDCCKWQVRVVDAGAFQQLNMKVFFSVNTVHLEL